MIRIQNKLKMKPLINKDGITIKQLKDLVNNLPDTNPTTGEEYEVWIMNTDKDGRSNSCKSILQLNKGDIIFNIRE
jgi:hypothetical protein